MLRAMLILLTSISTWFRSRLAMQMELIALCHQVAVYTNRAFPDRSFNRPIAYSGSAYHVYGRAGKMPWNSFSPAPCWLGRKSDSETTGDD
jgi:hypothetical protein